MIKLKKIAQQSVAIGLGTALLLTAGCSALPFRNPLALRTEPKLGELPPIAENTYGETAALAWTDHSLSKLPRFTKLVPSVAQDRLYAADHKGTVVALDRSTGKKIWRVNTSHKFTAGPKILDNSLVLLATAQGKIVALDISTGQVAWESKVSSEVLGAPVGGNGVVLAHAIDGSVTALDSKAGELLWRVDQSTPALTLHSSSAPVIFEDKAVVGFANGKLAALNLQTGLIEWERTVSLPRGRSEVQRMVDITADPIVDHNVVYAITYQGKLAAVNITTGDLLWDRELSSYHNMAIDKQHIYVTDNEHHLWAIDKQTGTTLWKQVALGQRYITGPTVVNDRVVVADRAGYIHAIASKNGNVIDRTRVSGKFYQDPVAYGQQFYFNAYNGKLAAFNLIREPS